MSHPTLHEADAPTRTDADSPDATTAASAADTCVLDVSGMDCASCVAHVTRAATALPGVSKADVNLARGRAVVAFDPAAVRPEQIAAAITDAGYPAAAQAADHSTRAAQAEEDRLQRQRAHAREWLRRALLGIALWLPVELTHWVLALTSGTAAHHRGVGWMDWLAFATSTVAMLFVGGGFYRSAWRAALRRTSNMDTLIALGATVAYGYSLVAFAGALLHWWHTLPNLYFMEATGLLALISLGHWLEARARDQAGSAIRELLNLTPPVALRLRAGGAETRGQGDKETRGQGHETLEDDAQPAATERPASVSLSPGPLVPLPPEYEEVPVSNLAHNDKILIRPGDRIPVDGLVEAGRSDVDESSLTGEPIPVPRAPGDEVISGTLNQTGRLVIRATRVGAETALAQIVRLVETAQNSRPPVQRLADAVAAVFVPAVLGIAVGTGIGWFIYGSIHHWPPGDTWAAVAKAVCAVLIIACPCALGLAVPAALMVGTGRGARRGILIRDIDALQHAERITTVVLDKTGTVTRGRPAVAAVLPSNGTPEGELLRLAAGAEQFSEHPLAKAIVARAQETGATIPDPDSFDYEPGLGVTATVDGQTLLVGNDPLLRKHGATDVPAPPPQQVGHRSIVHVARRGADGDVTHLGTLLIDDQVKPDSKTAIAELHAMGLKVLLLTGDNPTAARAIAAEVGIDDVRANVRPGEKAAVIRELQDGRHGGTEARRHEGAEQTSDEATKRRSDEGRAPTGNWQLATGNSAATRNSQPATRNRARVAMVGDGINDAPALAAADLGIAIGSGSDIAKETGGVVLVSESLHGIATALRLSRATMRKIRQNLFWAFLYNVLAIPLAALGILQPWMAAAAMALSDVTVIGNALLLRKTKID